jgi:dihydropteroate synthase
VRHGLEGILERATAAGIAAERVVLDAGYGFGKRFEENFMLLARQGELLELGRPLLAGVSRKSFLGHAVAPRHGGRPAPVDAREIASVAAMVTAILHGASLVRVHAVKPAVEAALVVDEVLKANLDL